MRRSFVVSLLATGTLIVGFAGSSLAQPDDVTKLPGLKWERIPSHDSDAVPEAQIVSVKRAKVPGGWLVHVRAGESGSVTFMPDPTHGWLRPEPKAKTKVVKAKPKVSATRSDTPTRGVLTAPKPKPSYVATDKPIPPAEQVPGVSWLRRLPGTRVRTLSRIPAAVHRKYQSFPQAYRLRHECGGTFTSGGFRIDWMQKTSFLATGLHLRVGDVIKSINGRSLGHDATQLHRVLRQERRFAIHLTRKGKDWLFPFEVPRWLGDGRK